MDNATLYLLIEIATSLGISVVVLLLLRPVLGVFLCELCRGETRAAFWNTFTRLMLLISPLLVVLQFSNSKSLYPISFAMELRDLLQHSLLGQFIGLVIVGKILLNFSRRAQEADFRHPAVDDIGDA